MELIRSRTRILKTKMEINQLSMNEDIHIVIGMIMYGVYIVLLNWMYIKEYLKDNPVIRRGTEWPD